MITLRKIGAFWGIIGVSLILGSAIMRLTPHVYDAIKLGMDPIQWLLLIGWSVFMLVTEGYQGFQKQFSPRVAARSLHLTKEGRAIDLLLAPLFCMGYFHATIRRIKISWTATGLIILLIITVRHFSQPWRGIIDSGVVLGLGYGLICFYIFTFKAFTTNRYPADPEVV